MRVFLIICIATISMINCNADDFAAEFQNKLYYLNQAKFQTLAKQSYTYTEKEATLLRKTTSNMQANNTTAIDISKYTVYSLSLLVPAVTTGIFLAKSEKPYNIALLTSHKLLATGNLFIQNYAAYKLYANNELNSAQTISLVAMDVIHICAIVTGAILTRNSDVDWIKKTHHYSSWLSFVSSLVFTYCLNSK